MIQTAVTVAICTKDHPTDLERSLRSLNASHDQPAEIVVIDSASASAHPIESVAKAGKARYVREDVPGRCAARNRAIREAKTEFIFFLDDDCEVDPDWLRNTLAGFERPEIACVTGRAIAREGANWAQRQVQSVRHWPSQPAEVGPREVGRVFVRAACGIGANMAFRRDALEHVGGFPRQPMTASEDDYAFYRIVAAGGRIRYCPDSTVYRAHRCTFAQNLWRSFEYGESEMQMVWLLSSQARSAGLFGRNAGSLLVRHASAPVRAFMRGAPAIATLHVAGFVGVLRGLWSPAFWRSPKPR